MVSFRATDLDGGGFDIACGGRVWSVDVRLEVNSPVGKLPELSSSLHLGRSLGVLPHPNVSCAIPFKIPHAADMPPSRRDN